MDDDFVRLDTLRTGLVRELLEETRDMKEDPPTDEPLRRATLGTIYQKRSTRTRVSFEAGMNQLGGDAVFLSADDIQLGRGETIGDTARALSRYVDALMARVHAHDEIEELVEYADVPVINGLSDFNHPCQALADSFTLQETKGELEGLKLAWVGDGNNVCNSVLHVFPRLGVSVRVATPDGHEPDADVVERARELADETGADATVSLYDTAEEAVEDADAVYTDTWVSMGEEGKDASVFEPFQVNEELLQRASDDCIFMHCLPAHRGQEVTDEVMDGPRSVVWRQAENRMHAQKALLVRTMGQARNG